MAMCRRDLDANAEVIAEEYRQGKSTIELAAKWACSPGAIRKRVAIGGGTLRSLSAAGTNRLKRPDQATHQKALVAKAAEANRGRTIPISVMRKRARARQIVHQRIGEFENVLATSLRARGFQVSQQIAVDRYNVDLALPPFVVEVHNSRHHPGSRPEIVKRIKRLLNAGWHVIYVWHSVGKWSAGFDVAVVTDQIVALMNLTSSHPAAPRQHWVLGSDGHDPARQRRKRHQWPGIEAAGRVGDSKSSNPS